MAIFIKLALFAVFVLLKTFGVFFTDFLTNIMAARCRPPKMFMFGEYNYRVWPFLDCCLTLISWYVGLCIAPVQFINSSCCPSSLVLADKLRLSLFYSYHRGKNTKY